MPTVEIQLANGKTAEVDMPEGSDPKTFIPHAYQMLSRAQTPQQQPSTMSQVASEVSRPVATMGSEFAQGMKRFGTYQPAEPGSAVDWITRGPQGGPLEIPRNPVSDVLASTINQGLGLAQALSSPRMAFGDLAGHAAYNLDKTLGGTEEGAQNVQQFANTMGSMGGPGALDTIIPRAVRNIGYAVNSAGAGPSRVADIASKANQESNVFTNLRNETAQANYAKSMAEFQQAQQDQANKAIASQAAQAESKRYVTETERALMSATGRAAPQTTNEQAYSFLNQNNTLPAIETTNLTKAAKQIGEELTGVPSSLAPAKLGKVSTELGATAGPTGPSNLPGLPDLSKMSDTQRSVWEPVFKQMQAGGTAPTLDKIQRMSQGLEPLMNSTDARVAGAGRFLYKNLMDDVRAAATKGIPEAQKYLQATEIARQNYAAAELSDFMTNSGTRVNKLGNIEIQPEKLSQKLRQGEFAGLRPEARTEIEAALQDVYNARKNIPEIYKAGKVGNKPPQPKLESLLPDEVAPRRESSLAGPLTIGAAAKMVVGAPYYAARAAATVYNRAIFQSALNPTGRRLLRTLYSDLPPRVNDAARMGAVINFLRSQGQNITVPQSTEQQIQPQMPMQGVPGGQ